MKKWFLRIIIVLVVVSICGFFFAKSYITRDYLVAEIEKSINSRIQIEDVDVNFYGLGGTVDLNHVIITQRDSNTDKKIPHDQREAIEVGDIQMKSASFTLSIWEILSKKILVEEIHFDGVVVNVTLFENGDSSIEELFAKPEKKKRSKVRKFNANDNEKFVTTINEIRLSDLEVNLIVEKTQLAVKGRELAIDLLNINVNPKQLETVNNAKVKISGTFDLHSLDTDTEYGMIVARGESDVTLFNTENGDLEPDMVVAITVGSDSYLTSKIPVISKLWKATDMVKKFGIDSFKLPEKVTFKNEQSARVGYKLGVGTLLDPMSIKIKGWELEFLAQSWLGSGNNMHDLGVKLHVGNAISKKLGGLLSKSSKVGGLMGKLTGGDSLLENGRLTLQLGSSGELSKPKIRLKNNIGKPVEGLMDHLLGGENKGSSKDKLKAAGKDLLKGFLK